MKEHRSKPVGRLKDRSMVEVSLTRHTEKVVAEATTVSDAKQCELVHRQPCGSSVQEVSKLADNRAEILYQQVLPDGVPCEQEMTVGRSIRSEKTASRLFGFEERFPCRQQGFREKPAQRTSKREECITNRPSGLEKPTRSIYSKKLPTIRSHMSEPTRKEEPKKRLHHGSKDQHKSRAIPQDTTLGVCAKGETQLQQKTQSIFQEKLENDSEGHTQPKNGLNGNEKAQTHAQRTKRYQEGSGTDGTSQSSLNDEQEVEENTSRDFQKYTHSPEESRSHYQLSRHQPHIRGSRNLNERAPFPHLRECPDGTHELEAKLVQRQLYLQEKIRSRKMLLGSVIPSDMTFSSEACRNWQSATILAYRYREEQSFKHMVLSGDSGVSMGEGSSASRRNSETETDDVPTIIAEVGEVVHRRVPSKCQKCQRTRSEMKDASSQHSLPPSETESPPSSPVTESIHSVKLETTALDVMSPPPPNRVYQCRVIRDKNMYGTMFYPVYRMYLEVDGRPQVLMLTARKRKKCSTSKYLICTGNDGLRRKSSSLVGKLRSNLVGTRFHLATYFRGSESEAAHRPPESPYKFDSLLLFYETNFLGTKGPRRMKVFLPEVGKVDDRLNLLDEVRDGSMEKIVSLINKEPEWDPETLSHILYFKGRVTKSSVKNFQLVEPPDESSVLLQFGKIGRDEFTLDYHPPINAVQAFAIALSSFDGKIACE